MEHLMVDALKVQALLPWVESDDIINFMRKIPLDKSYLRHQITLHYFLKQRDSHGKEDDSFEQQTEDDARQLVLVMPDRSYKEIKDRLSILGNMPNRKEAVLRQLLHENDELDKVVKDINSNNNKRKLNIPVENVFDLDSNSNETNIKIKIFKKEGSLQVVSSIQQEIPSPSKVQKTSDTPSSSTVISSSTNQPESNLPDSTVPSTSGATHIDYDPCPEFTAILQNLVDTKKPSTSSSMMPSLNSNLTSSEHNNMELPSLSNLDQRNGEVEANQKPTSNISVITKTSDSLSNVVEKEPEFNLVGFIQELTQAPEKRILKLCKKMKLERNKRPSDQILTYIINQLFEEVIEVQSDNSSESDTQEYQITDDCLKNIPRNVLNSNGTVPPKNVPENAPLNSNAKEFKLKQPVLVYNLISPPSTSKQKNILKPSRLILQNESKHEGNEIIPALPNAVKNESNLDELGSKDVKQEPNVRIINVKECLPVPSNNNRQETVIVDKNKNINDFQVAGPSKPPEKKRNIEERLVLKLIEMLPNACPEYIRDVCDGKKWSECDSVLTTILSNDYPKRPQRPPSPVKEVDLDDQLEILKELLPDADPTYLRMQCEKYANDSKGLREFIDQAMELKNYPTMKDYLRKQQLSAQQRQYTTEFNIEHFIQLFPDPEKTFKDPKRTVQIGPYEQHYLNLYFRNKYDRISARQIQIILAEHGNRISTTNQKLEELMLNKSTMKSRRKPVPLPDNMQNIPLLQELAYLTHKTEIETYLQEKRKREEQERLEAKENGLLQTCQCCYDEEVMLKDTFTCPNGCSFCKDCIKKSCEIALGEGKTDFTCLADCKSEFTLQTLQHVLPPKMFSKLAQKKALAEIKAAGIEELEMCPFCDFATIPNEADKIFRCLNPDCMKESCRSCKEPNHVPLKCEEVEKDQDVKARTYIENKMTEALLRKCWKCNTSFFKEEGCNKMTCSCGAQMCYICKKPVKDYSHFNGIGGDRFNLCPLYSDTNLINQQNVLGAAAAAKAEVDPSKLKVDPTADVEAHYKKRAKQLPREPHMDLIHVALAPRYVPMFPQQQHHRHHHRHHNRHQHLPPPHLPPPPNHLPPPLNHPPLPPPRIDHRPVGPHVAVLHQRIIHPDLHRPNRRDQQMPMDYQNR